MLFLKNEKSIDFAQEIINFIAKSEFVASVIVVFAAWVFGRMAERIVYNLILFLSKNRDKVKTNKLLKSYCNIISTVLKYVIYIVAIFLILGIYQVKLITIVASAGFIGVMITYIFQDLIKDITNGFYIVFSSPFEVGDNIKINEFVGQVREITSRYVVIITAQGDRCIINNRVIDQVIVYNKGINFKKRV